MKMTRKPLIDEGKGGQARRYIRRVLMMGKPHRRKGTQFTQGAHFSGLCNTMVSMSPKLMSLPSYDMRNKQICKTINIRV